MSFAKKLASRLENSKVVTLEQSEVPKSYWEQPYNLAAKLRERYGIESRVIVTQHNISILKTCHTELQSAQ